MKSIIGSIFALTFATTFSTAVGIICIALSNKNARSKFVRAAEDIRDGAEESMRMLDDKVLKPIVKIRRTMRITGVQ